MPKINLLENEHIQALLNSVLEADFLPDIDLIDEKAEEEARAQVKNMRIFSLYQAVEGDLKKLATLDVDPEKVQAHFDKVQETIQATAKELGLEEKDTALTKLLQIIEAEKNYYLYIMGIEKAYSSHRKNADIIESVKDLIEPLLIRQAQAEGSNNKALSHVLQSAIDALMNKNISALLDAKKEHPGYTTPTPSLAQDLALIERTETSILTLQFNTLLASSKLDLADKNTLQSLYALGKSINTALVKSETSKNHIIGLLASLDKATLTHLTKGMMLAIQDITTNYALRSNGRFVVELYRRCAKKYMLEHKLAKGDAIPEEMHMLHRVMLQGIIDVLRSTNQNIEEESLLQCLDGQIIFGLKPEMTPEEEAQLMAERAKRGAAIQAAAAAAFEKGEAAPKMEIPKGECLPPKKRALVRAGLEDILASLKKVEVLEEKKAEPAAAQAVQLEPNAFLHANKPRIKKTDADARRKQTKRHFDATPFSLENQPPEVAAKPLVAKQPEVALPPPPPPRAQVLPPPPPPRNALAGQNGHSAYPRMSFAPAANHVPAAAAAKPSEAEAQPVAEPGRARSHTQALAAKLGEGIIKGLQGGPPPKAGGQAPTGGR